MQDLLEKASYIRLPIPEVKGVLTDGSPELLYQVRRTIDESHDGND